MHGAAERGRVAAPLIFRKDGDKSYFTDCLQNATWLVRALDQRGHGDSAWAQPPDYSYARYAADVAEVVDKLDLRDFVLMGHSMGGAGTIYLGVKYASNWAAIGAEAPATAPAGITPTNYPLTPAKNIPMIIVQGDWDELVPVVGTRLWIDQAKELGMDHKYVEIPCGTHGTPLTAAVPDILPPVTIVAFPSRT